MFSGVARRSLQAAALAAFLAATTPASGAQISEAVLRDEILHASVGPELPSLNEQGYQQVAGLKDDSAMKDFVKRILAVYDRYVQDEGELSGFVPHYSGTVALQDFERLKSELMRVPWVSSEKPPQGPPQPSAPAEALQPKGPPQKQQEPPQKQQEPPQKQQEPPQQQQQEQQQDDQHQQPRPLQPPHPDASDEVSPKEGRKRERSRSHTGTEEDVHPMDHKGHGKERNEDCSGGKCPKGRGRDGRRKGSDSDGRRKGRDRNKEDGRKHRSHSRDGKTGERRKRHAARKLSADRRMLVSAVGAPNSTSSSIAEVATAQPLQVPPAQKDQEAPQSIAQAMITQPPAVQQQQEQHEQQEQQERQQQPQAELQQVPSESPLRSQAEAAGTLVAEPPVPTAQPKNQLPEVKADGRPLPEVDAIMGEASESMSDFASQAQFMEQQVQQRQEAIKGALNVAKEHFEQKLHDMQQANKNVAADNEHLRASNAELKASNVKMEGKLKNLQDAGTALMSTLQGLASKTKNAHQFVTDCINLTDDSKLDEVKVLLPAAPKPTLDYFMKVTYSDSAAANAVAGKGLPPVQAPASVVTPPVASGSAPSFTTMPSPVDWEKAAKAQREREALSLFEREISGVGEVSDLPELGDAGVEATSFIQLESTVAEQAQGHGRGQRAGPEDLVSALATGLVNLESASQEAHSHLKAKFVAAREAELLRGSALKGSYQSLQEEKQQLIARQGELTSMRRHLISTVQAMREKLEAFHVFANKAAEALDKSEAGIFAPVQHNTI